MGDILSLLRDDEAPNFDKQIQGCGLGLLAVAYAAHGYEIEPTDDGGLVAVRDYDLSDYPYTAIFEHNEQGELTACGMYYGDCKPKLGKVSVEGYTRVFISDDAGDLQEDSAFQLRDDHHITIIHHKTRRDWLTLKAGY